LTAPLKTQQSEGLSGNLLQPGQHISSFSAPVTSPHLEVLIQPGPQAYRETGSNPGTKKEADSSQLFRPTNTRDIQMMKGKYKTISNRSQNMWESREPSSPTTVSPEYTNTPEKSGSCSKILLMKLIESFKEAINNSLKEIQENTGKQVKELNKVIQDLKMEVETIKKAQMEANLETENLGKESGITDVNITNRIQEIEERISGVEDTVEEIDTIVEENSKHKKLLTQSIQEIQITMKRPNLRIIRKEENEDSQLNGPELVFNKIIEENFPNLKKEMAIKVQEAYRPSHKWDQKRKSSRHIIIKTLNAENKTKQNKRDY
jgi:hypothetical protein